MDMKSATVDLDVIRTARDLCSLIERAEFACTYTKGEAARLSDEVLAGLMAMFPDNK